MYDVVGGVADEHPYSLVVATQSEYSGSISTHLTGAI